HHTCTCGNLLCTHNSTGRLPPLPPPLNLEACGPLPQALNLLGREAAELACLLRDRDGHGLMVAVLPRAAQVEALVDRLLELDGLATPLGVAARELVEPARAHADVRDLVGQHVVDRLL